MDRYQNRPTDMHAPIGLTTKSRETEKMSLLKNIQSQKNEYRNEQTYRLFWTNPSLKQS